MYLLPTDEQEEIADTVYEVLTAEFPIADLNRFDGASTLVDRSQWKQFGELGWFGIGVEESFGGVGYSVIEEILLAEQLGRTLAPGPFIGQIVGAHLALSTKNAFDAGSIMECDKTVGLGWPLDDENILVTYPECDLIAVVDSTGSALVENNPSDLRNIESLDPLTPLATAPKPDLSQGDHVYFLKALLLVSAKMSGIATGCSEQSVSYVGEREQFGQPVGGFQAVKHRCADMATRADAAVSQTRWAATKLSETLDSGDGVTESARFACSAAKLVATESAIANAQTNIQNHGGIGFTWEHSAHRFVTRSRVYEHAIISSMANTAAFLEESP